MTITAAKPSEKDSGWDAAFDQQAAEEGGREKPVHVLNARQLEYVAHLKRTQGQQQKAKE